MPLAVEPQSILGQGHTLFPGTAGRGRLGVDSE